MGTGSTMKAVKMRFMVVNTPTSYDVIFAHLCMKYRVGNLVGVIQANQHIARRSYDKSTRVLEGRWGRYTMLDEHTRIHLLEVDPRFD
ncbi:hypothetical protein CR513_59790, partial [Mucuna pruriens]